jgi:predicted dehydrogenase
MDKQTINWAILGLGKIAQKFAHDLSLHPHATLQAVASRSEEKARTFANKFNVKSAYSSYEALVQDSMVDIIYIATPHAMHKEHSLLCLKHGKAVLCEKPMGLNEQQSQSIVDAATQQKLFFMEGLWTRFIPATQKVLDLIKDGAIGSPVLLTADFGFSADFQPNHRLFNPKLGGGALLDIGLYPIYLSQLIFGEPTQTQAMARFSSTAVDLSCNILLNHQDEAKSILFATLEANTPTEATIYGTKGHLKLQSRFHHSQQLQLVKGDEITEFDIPYTGLGYYHEIEEVHRCLQNGLQESVLLPHSQSLALSRTLDKVKEAIGLHHPITPK